MGEDENDSAGSDAVPRDGPSFDLVAATLPHEPTQCILQSTPTVRIDMFHTVFSRILPTRVLSTQRFGRWWMMIAFWIGQCIITVLPIVDHVVDAPLVSNLMAWIGSLVSIPALVVGTGQLNVDMVSLLCDESEFRSGLVLNTMQWVFIAISFNFDCRACVCVVEWWVVQLAFAADADVRFYGQQLRAPIIAWIITLVYWSYSLLGVLPRSFQPLFTINGQSSSVNDILLWTSPTLCVILLKGIYIRMKQQTQNPNSTSASEKTINVFCTMVKVRLTLGKVSNTGSRTQSSAYNRQNPSCVRLLRSNSTLVYIDVTSMCAAIPFPFPENGIHATFFMLLYTTGVLSFTASCVATFLSQIHAVTLPNSHAAVILASCALLGSAVFCGFTARFFHGCLLREIFQTFEVLFSSIQFLIGAILMCEMFKWDARCVNVITWIIWFHWLLSIDALTPPVRTYLRLKKLAVTPVALMFVYGFAGPFVLLYGYANTKIFDRELGAHVRISTLVLSRMLTLWLWCGHLVWNLGVREDREFVFLKDYAHYCVPPDSLTSSPMGWTAGNVVVPAQTISPRLPVPTSRTTPAPNPSPSPMPR